ncbi:hypothetical protein IVB33_39115 [Bradyrhizobium sp. 24]|nr:hypothetical protein [Bradyrhizobium sp. 37]MCK1382379.1 hypothetical protein [Bradyrhizobium sp. 24]MCK1771440.1 hypothetical protein [Bradyrhizobium sp. 134]
MLSSLRKGSVIVDVAIDQGRCFETSSSDDACLPKIRGGRCHSLLRGQYAGAVPLTSSQALKNATLPFGLALADQGFAALSRPAPL